MKRFPYLLYLYLGIYWLSSCATLPSEDPAPNPMTPFFDIRAVDVPDSLFVGETIRLRFEVLSPDYNEDVSQREWRFRRPDRSNAQLSGSDQDDLRTFVPDVPGFYRVTVRPRAVGAVTSGDTQWGGRVFPVGGPREVSVVGPSNEARLTEGPIRLEFEVSNAESANLSLYFNINGIEEVAATRARNGINTFEYSCLDPGEYRLFAELRLPDQTTLVSGSNVIFFEVSDEACGLPASIPCGQGAECSPDQVFVPNEACVAKSSLIPAENLLTNQSFEGSEGSLSRGDVPNRTGVWQGDWGEITPDRDASAQYHQIQPAEGRQMLRFIASTPERASSRTGSSEIFQSYQLSEAQLAQLSDSSKSFEAVFTVYFNRVQGNANTDTRFISRLYAMTGEPETFRAQFDAGIPTEQRVVGSLFSDPCVDTWEKVEIRIDLTAETNFIVVYLAAVENIQNEEGLDAEYDGHYADASSLVIREK